MSIANEGQGLDHRSWAVPVGTYESSGKDKVSGTFHAQNLNLAVCLDISHVTIFHCFHRYDSRSLDVPYTKFVVILGLGQVKKPRHPYVLVSSFDH